MVIYETLSGHIPFAPDEALFIKILRGERPRRPEGTQCVSFTDSEGEVLILCWRSQPNDRPSLNAVRRCLQYDISPSTYLDADVETDADEQSNATTTGSSGTFSLLSELRYLP
jgi:hypothetical protein